MFTLIEIDYEAFIEQIQIELGVCSPTGEAMVGSLLAKFIINVA